MRSLFIALALGLLAGPGRASADEPLTRAYVVARALASSPALEAAEARIRAAEAGVRGTSLPDPMVSARFWGLPTRFDGPPTQTMIMAEQTFPLARIRDSESGVAREGASVRAAEREVAQHVVAREASLMLVEVCEADAMQRALTETRALYARLRDVAAARTLVMSEDAVDVALLDVSLARLDADVAEATLTAASRRAELATMLDVDRATLGACGELASEARGDEDALVARAIDARPELRRALAERAQADAMRTNARAMSAPMLTVGAGVMLMAEQEHVQMDRVQWMLEVGSTLPVSRRARNARRAVAQAMADEADAMRLDLARMIEREVRRLYAMRAASTARAEALRGAVRERLDAARETAIARYRIDGDVVSVLEVVRMSREIVEERVAADFAVARADVELTHAVGLGLGEDTE